MTYYRLVPSPIGSLLVTSDGAAITGTYMEAFDGGPTDNSEFASSGPRGFGELLKGDWKTGEELPVLQEAERQLGQYFSHERRAFELPLSPEGTAFQRQVWMALTAIPFGTVVSYAALARAIGKPEAFRAVGLANGRNPISVIVPCHRVIGANGSLIGYGGGLDRKRWLLRHEGLDEGEQPELLL